MKKATAEESGSLPSKNVVRSAIPRGFSLGTASSGSPSGRTSGTRQSGPRRTDSEEKEVLQASTVALKEIGILELLDQDDRFCFILDLVDKNNFQPGPLHFVFVNKLLKASSVVDTVRGEDSEDNARFGSFPEFKAWTVSYVRNHEATDVSLPSFLFCGATWSCISLRRRFRVFYGTPSGTAMSTSAASSDTARYLSSTGVTPDRLNTVSEEAQDYFGNAHLSSGSGLRSPLASTVAALKSPGNIGRSLNTALKSSRRQSWRPPRSPLGHPAEDASSKRKASHSTLSEGSHPERRDSDSSVSSAGAFFDWTRMPLSPTLPKHIQFAKTVDWSATSLGPMENWSSDLRFMCNLLMASPHPAAMYWGHDNVTLYNEPYIFMAGQKHPSLMGATYEAAWQEIWEDIKDSFATVKATGQVVKQENDRIFLNRQGYLEETTFSWSLIPLVGRDGSVAGLFNPAFESTRRSLTERRMLTLREIGEATASARDIKSFWGQVLKGIEYNEYDAPFVLLYSVADERGSDEMSVQSNSSIGASQCILEGSLPQIPEDHKAAPTIVDLKPGSDGLGAAFREALYTEKPVLLETANGTLDPALVEDIDCRGFPEKPRAAVACAIHPTTGDSVLGFLVMGINPRRPYDDDYHLFVQLMSRQLATSIASVVLHEEEIRRGQKAAQLAALDRIELSEQLAARTKEAIENESRFTQMAELAPVGMFIADSQGDIVFTNNMFHQISKHPKSCDRDAWFDSIKDEDRQMVKTKWEKLVRDKVPMTAEFRFTAQFEDGNGNTGETWVLESAYPQTDAESNLISIFGSITNISQQKWAEDVQIKRTAEANEMRLQQSRFVDIICHEIRNPLSAILQCADEISASLLDFRADSKDRSMPLSLLESNIDAAQTISLCSFHQTRIVSDVLTISKLDSALLLVTPVDVRPTTIVHQALKMFEAELHQADIKMEFTIDQSAKDLNIDWVRFDPSRLLQVMINLITNAIKFTSNQAHRSINIMLSAYCDRPSHLSSLGVTYITARAPHRDITNEDKDWGPGKHVFLQFAVQDTGKGLTEAEKKLLFLRFSQASPKTHVQYGGSGLGLFISRELVELQGGEIGVASERGKGSTFAFYIQARTSDGPPSGTEHTPMSAAMRKTSLPSRSVRSKPSLEAAAAAEQLSSISSSSGGSASPNKTAAVAAAAAAAGTAAPPPPPPSGPAPFSMASLRVLIVEDNEVNQRVLSKQLRNLGAMVGVANHGGECIEFLQRTRHWAGHESGGEDLGIILMDLEMPVMDGLTCTREIRRLEGEGTLVRHLPVIAVYVSLPSYGGVVKVLIRF